MYHDIEKEPLPFLLRHAYLKKLSGHLYVTAKDFHISLNVQNGMLANGMSTRFDEKLSVILHLMGRINEEQYLFLNGLQPFSEDQVLQTLLDQNFAKKKDIYYARIYQLRRIAISTFSMQRGQWIFTAGEADPPLREIYEIPLAGILVEGARAIDHASIYSSRWLRHIPVLFKEIPMDNEIYFTDAERDFFAAVQSQGRRNCQELIACLNILPIDFWRSVLAFHLLGIIEFEKGGETSDMSWNSAAALQRNQQMEAGAVAIPELQVEPELVSQAQEFAELAAPADADFEFELSPQFEIEPELQVTPEFPGMPAAREDEPEPPFYTPPREFTPAAAPPSRLITDSDHEKAWDMLLHSKELYEKHEYALAVPLLKKAIKLEPGQGDFYYLLGLCQAEAEISKNEAEMNLKKAVELKSWSADPVYALGVLYRGQGKMNLAERCFQRVKEIAYEHTGASRALVDLRRQKAGSGHSPHGLKKKKF